MILLGSGTFPTFVILLPWHLQNRQHWLGREHCGTAPGRQSCHGWLVEICFKTLSKSGPLFLWDGKTGWNKHGSDFFLPRLPFCGDQIMHWNTEDPWVHLPLDKAFTLNWASDCQWPKAIKAGACLVFSGILPGQDQPGTYLAKWRNIQYWWERKYPDRRGRVALEGVVFKHNERHLLYYSISNSSKEGICSGFPGS